MSVVVNEFDVVPAAAGGEPAPRRARLQARRSRLSPAAVGEVERALKLRTERRQRLEAY